MANEQLSEMRSWIEDSLRKEKLESIPSPRSKSIKSAKRKTVMQNTVDSTFDYTKRTASKQVSI